MEVCQKYYKIDLDFLDFQIIIIYLNKMIYILRKSRAKFVSLNIKERGRSKALKALFFSLMQINSMNETNQIYIKNRLFFDNFYPN